jgi:HlyD family secretion protein
VAQARLAKLAIVAPMDARVLTRNTEPGAMAQPGRVLLSLAAEGPLRIDAAVDAQRGTVPVRLAVRQPPGFLRPDMTVSVEMLGGEKKDALILSAAAVRDADSPAPWVLALREGRAQRVPVTLGLRGVGVVEITSGLQDGERVIPQTEKAAPGDRVRALAAQDAPRPMDVPQGMISR